MRLAVTAVFAAMLIATGAMAAPADMRPEDRANLEVELAQDQAEGKAVAVPPATSSLAPPIDWEASVDRYLVTYLKDPYSAVKVVTRSPRLAAIKPDVWRSWAGWAVCYSVNAKNSYGGYIGARTFLFVVDGHGVVGALQADGDSIWNDGIVRRECAMSADAMPSM